MDVERLIDELQKALTTIDDALASTPGPFEWSPFTYQAVEEAGDAVRRAIRTARRNQ